MTTRSFALYSQMLPGEFIHYGYFDDTSRVPQEMSFAELAGKFDTPRCCWKPLEPAAERCWTSAAGWADCAGCWPSEDFHRWP